MGIELLITAVIAVVSAFAGKFLGEQADKRKPSPAPEPDAGPLSNRPVLNAILKELARLLERKFAEAKIEGHNPISVNVEVKEDKRKVVR